MKTISEIECEIGYPSGNKVFANNVAMDLAGSRATRRLLVEWLRLKGVPYSSATGATQRSQVLAYTEPKYLNGWLRRTNPGATIVDTTTDDDLFVDDDGDDKPKPVETTAPAPNRQQTEQWLNGLHAQISQAVDRQVQAKLDATTIKLDPTVKDQIKQLATDAASARVAELMPPREIVVKTSDVAPGTNVGLQHKNFPILLRACSARNHKGFRLNIWLTGPTGSGKTSAAEAIAKALGLDFASDGSLDADYKVLGFRDANGNIISTEFIRIYRNGGIYCADEIDNWMPGALLSLNAALANGWMSTPEGMIKRHPDAVIIACANTWGLGATNDYVGRTRLDAASLNRFLPKIDWPYDEELEGAIAANMDTDCGPRWHKVVCAARKAAKAQGLKIIISPRDTLDGLALLRQDFSALEVINMTFGAGISPEQHKALGLEQLAAVYKINTTTTTTTTTIAPNLGPTFNSMRDVLDKVYKADSVVDAIRIYRDANNCGLYDAKRAVEAIRNTVPAEDFA